jgi:hypothetical protein
VLESNTKITETDVLARKRSFRGKNYKLHTFFLKKLVPSHRRLGTDTDML